MISLVFAVAVAAAQPRQRPAEPQCDLDMKHWAPALADESSAFAGKVERKRDSLSLRETVTLREGGQLIVDVGGCHHLAKSYKLSALKDATPLIDQAHYLEAAAKFLERTVGPKGAPLDGPLASDVRRAEQLLSRAKVEDGSSAALRSECDANECLSRFACDDASCGVAVKRIDADTVELVATYTFAI
jgi:hypothetical protein